MLESASGGGVSALGGLLPGGCLLRRGICSQGVSAPGGLSAHVGGCLLPGEGGVYS